MLLIWSPDSGPGAPVAVTRNPLVFRTRHPLVWGPAPFATTTPNSAFPPQQPIVVRPEQPVEPEAPRTLLLFSPFRIVPAPRPIIVAAELPPDQLFVSQLFRAPLPSSAPPIIPPPRVVVVPADRLPDEGSALIVHAPQPLHLPVWPTRVVVVQHVHLEEWPEAVTRVLRPVFLSISVFDGCVHVTNPGLSVPVAAGVGFSLPVATGFGMNVPVASSAEECG